MRAPLARLSRAAQASLDRLYALGTWRVVALAVCAVAIAAALGVAAVAQQDYAILAAFAVLAAGLALADPPLVLVLAVPATLLQARVGGLLSISDVVLALATGVALVFVRPQGTRIMQPLMWAGTVYLAAAVPTLILNPYAANIVEWAHEVVLIFGSLLVGFGIARAGRAEFAARFYVAACVFIGVWAALTALVMMARGSFDAVYLPQLHKNTIGGMLCIALVMVYARPTWLRLGTRAMWWSMLALTAGMLAAQSRQALVGAVVGVIVVSLRRRPESGRFPVMPWIVAVPAIVFVFALLSDQLESGDQYNSAYQRLNWYSATFDIWETSPIFGVGLRWWYTQRFGAQFQPPNAELEVLSSVGVVGLAAFLLMFVIAVIALWRMNPVYGTVGVAVVLARFTQAQFDLYWVAGQASLLWIVAGMCYGAQERDRASGIEAMPPVVRGRRRVHRVRASRSPAAAGTSPAPRRTVATR